MKLYTEEQVIQAFKDGFVTAINEGTYDYVNEYMDELTPIELPSEDKIEEYIKTFPYTKHLDDGQYNDGVIDGIELGINWYKEQLKNNL